MNILPENTQTFLLNISLLFICFTLYFKFIERKMNPLTSKIIITLISGISIIFFMTFPLKLTESDYIFFGQVPLIIGALYGGRRVTLILILTLLTSRFFLDWPGFYLVLFLYCLLYISLYFIIPSFQKTVNTRKKLYFAILASLLGLGVRLVIVFALFSEESIINHFIFIISLSFFQLLAILFFVIFNEKTRKEAVLNNELNKLEKLKTVSELTASISHEIRNPLTVTKGFLQFLKEPNLTEQEKIHYIDIAIDALDQAESRITDYLTFAKPSLENIKILNLQEELIYIKNFIDPYATMNNVHIEVQIEEDIYIAGEDQKLHQCLINVVKNGIESMPQGGNLIIALQKDVSKAIITVTDTGIGMNEEQVKRLGSPFFTTKDIGTGIGTMVVYSIVKAMRGEIIVKSEIGKGTSFSIRLPLAENSLSPVEEMPDKLSIPSL